MKHKILISAIIGSLGISFAACSHAAKTSYYFIKVKHSNKCVSQSGGIQDEGGRVTQWDCIDAPNIKLEKIDVGGNNFMLRFPHSEKCLTVEGARVTNGTNIIQSTCQLDTAPAEQTWKEVPTATQPYVQIQSSLGACLAQEGASQTNGGNILLWQCVNKSNVEWKFVRADCSEFLQPYIDHAKASSLNKVHYTMISNVEGGVSYWAQGKLSFSGPTILSPSSRFTGNLVRLDSSATNRCPGTNFAACGNFNPDIPYKPTILSITKAGVFFPSKAPIVFGDNSDITVSVKGEVSGAKVECSRGHMYGFYLNPGDFKNIMFDITLKKGTEPK